MAVGRIGETLDYPTKLILCAEEYKVYEITSQNKNEKACPPIQQSSDVEEESYGEEEETWEPQQSYLETFLRLGLWDIENCQPKLKLIREECLISGNALELSAELCRLIRRQGKFEWDLNNVSQVDDDAEAERFAAQLLKLITQMDNQAGYLRFIDFLFAEADRLLIEQLDQPWNEAKYLYLNCAGAYAEKFENAETSLIKMHFLEKNEIEQYPRQLQVVFENGDSKEIGFKINSFLINESEITIQERVEEYSFDNIEYNKINLRFVPVSTLFVRKCQNIIFLDISHTCLEHLDIRNLVELQELELMNTNIKRLNLVNERDLEKLFCNYTEIQFIRVFDPAGILELHAEHSGFLKSNRLTENRSVFSSDRETIGNYSATIFIEEWLEEYTVCCPKTQDNCKFKYWLPENTNEMIIGGIEEYEEIDINGYQDYYYGNTNIFSFEINFFSNLRYFFCLHLKCKELIITDSPQLIIIDIEESFIAKVAIKKLCNLEKLSCFLSDLSVLQISSLPLLSELMFEGTDVSVSNLFKFKSLKVICPGDEKMGTQLPNLPQLIVINLCNKKMDNVIITNLLMLQEIHADSLICQSFKIKNLPALRKLDIRSTNIEIPNLLEFKELEGLGPNCEEIINESRRLPELIEINLSDYRFNTVEISDFTNLKKITAYSLKLKVIKITKLPELSEISITHSEISFFEIIGFSMLEEIYITRSKCDFINISNVPSLVLLSIKHSDIQIPNLEELETVRDIRISSQCMLGEVKNLQHLKAIDICEAVIADVEIIGFPTLERIYSELLRCSSFKISNLPALEILNTRMTGLFISNITEFKKLKEIHTNSREEIDLILDSNIAEELLLLDISFRCTETANIDIPLNQKEIKKEEEYMREIDLSNCKHLVVVIADKDEIIKNCCANIILSDKFSFHYNLEKRRYEIKYPADRNEPP